jgi:cell wall-associated NlpC family hydrolase
MRRAGLLPFGCTPFGFAGPVGALPASSASTGFWFASSARLIPLLKLLTLLLVALLAACSSAPQRTVRGGSNGASSTAGAYRTPPGFPNFVDHSIGREEISIQAMSLVGVPYRWGGNTPTAGFDCSGLVHYVVQRAASVNLPRTTADMSSRGASIDPDEIAAGDLVFFNTTGRPHSHVGIYVGKLRFVNAPSTGGTVRLDYLTNPYWAKRFDGIRRVAPPLAPSKPTPFDEPTYEAAAPKPGGNGGDAAGAAVTAVAAPAAVSPLAARAAANDQAPLTAQRDSRAAAARAPAAAVAGNGAGASPAASADAFEPPPSAMSAAQSQARAAGAATPEVVAAPEPTPDNGMAAQAPLTQPSSAYANAPASQTWQARGASPQSVAPVAQAPDPIDAAADAYEPPPSSAVTAARQAQAAQQAPQASGWQRPAASGGVQIMRASTVSRGVPAPTQTNDDPIAGFANGSY